MTARPLEEQVEEACTLVEGMCAPSLMSAAEAIDFLEDVIVRLEQTVDALREQLDGHQR